MPHYNQARKRDIVKKLHKLAESADAIYLASDPDREGEAIAWHVAEEVKRPGIKVGRIVFHEITRRAIEQAMKTPQSLNASLYDAQKARRVMDRIVGYTMSPLLWKRVKRGLSAGRVQSVAVRLICMRQEEIEKFVPQEYWTIDATLKTPDGDTLTARVVKPKEIPDEESSRRIADAIRQARDITVEKVKKQVRQKHPCPLHHLHPPAGRPSRLQLLGQKTMTVPSTLRGRSRSEAARSPDSHHMRRLPGGLGRGIKQLARSSPGPSGRNTSRRNPASTRPRNRPSRPTRPSGRPR